MGYGMMMAPVVMGGMVSEETYAKLHLETIPFSLPSFAHSIH